MSLEAIYRKPRTSEPQPGHRTYPYRRSWKGAREVGSLGVMSWQLSKTMEGAFCTDSLDKALRSGPRPEIFNTDQ